MSNVVKNPEQEPACLPGSEGGKPLRLGRGFIIGCIVASFALFITLLALSYAYPAVNKLQNAPPPAEWTQKMERIGVCLLYYAAKHDGKLPPALSTLAKDGYVKDFSQFDAADMPGKAQTEAEIDSPNADFLYLLPAGLIGDKPQDVLKQNLPDGLGRVLALSRKGLSWNTPSPAKPDIQPR